MTRAGADKVVSPYHIGGIRIAHTILKPTVVDFLELTAKAGNMEIQIEEGDKVAVIGEPEHFSQFEKMARGKKKSDSSDKTSTPLPEF